MVSLHIPAYNEPPELLIETIKAAERIDYPNFEIVVMDNNTSDPAVYGPVEEYCRDRPRRTVRPCGPVAGIQGRCLQPGVAPLHRSTGRDHRPDRR